MDSITKCVKAKMLREIARNDEEGRGIYKTVGLPKGKNASRIMEIDKEIEKLAKDRRALSFDKTKLSTEKKLAIGDRQDELRIMLIKLGDKGGRCSWCLMRIKGKPYKVRSVDRTRLSRKETIWDSCKQCSDEFKAWGKRSYKWLKDPNCVLRINIGHTK